jgi:septum formation protein
MKTARPASDPRAATAGRAELILASASAGRAAVLRGAGLEFRQLPADVDERAIEALLAAESPLADAGQLALTLAAEKAKAVSRQHPEALVLGADQIMECGGEILHKPVDLTAARDQLASLRDNTHQLHSALAIAEGGEIAWQHVDKARLTMRAFSDAFLDAYVAAEGETLLRSVGGYRIEGLGIQLFSRVEGDHFTIIGLPLLPLLDYLRARTWLPS